MRNIHNLVKYCVPSIGGTISQPFHDVANPNLVGRYNMTRKVTSPMVPMKIIVAMAT